MHGYADDMGFSWRQAPIKKEPQPGISEVLDRALRDLNRTYPGGDTTMTRPQINITPPERAGRIVIGGAAAIAGLVALASASGALAVVLLALLVLAGLDLVVTGALGHCPLYHKLGHMPSSLRRPA
jgi:hypothetical protein